MKPNQFKNVISPGVFTLFLLISASGLAQEPTPNEPPANGTVEGVTDNTETEKPDTESAAESTGEAPQDTGPTTDNTEGEAQTDSAETGTEEEPTSMEPAPEQTEEPVPAPIAEETPVTEEPDPLDETIALAPQDGALYDNQPAIEPVDDRPFGKGTMELGLGLGAFGNSEYFAMSIGTSFAYFVIPGLAPGIDLLYTARWGDLDYPQSFTIIPFLKYVFYRNKRFSPYVIVGGGRDFQWSGTDDPTKGYASIDAWIFEVGGGAYIGMGDRMALQIQLVTQYYKFDELVDIVGDGTDEPVDGDWYFPIFSLGISFYF